LFCFSFSHGLSVFLLRYSEPSYKLLFFRSDLIGKGVTKTVSLRLSPLRPVSIFYVSPFPPFDYRSSRYFICEFEVHIGSGHLSVSGSAFMMILSLLWVSDVAMASTPRLLLSFFITILARFFPPLSQPGLTFLGPWRPSAFYVEMAFCFLVSLSVTCNGGPDVMVFLRFIPPPPLRSDPSSSRR